MADIEQLQQEVSELRISLKALKDKERRRQRANYDSSYNKIRQAVLDSSNIDNFIEKVYSELGLSDLFSDLIIINNPYSDSLGFRFIDIIESNVKDILLNGLPDNEGADGKKNRLLRIIQKVINNPIADVILKSNPIGAVVSNVIGIASNFIDTQVTNIEKTDVGKAIKKFALVTKDEIGNDKLILFKNKMQKYSDFYSGMLSTSETFDTRIDIIKNSYESFYLNYKDYNSQYFSKLGITANNTFEGIDLLFDKPNSQNEDFDFEEILNKREILEGIAFIKKMEIVRAEIEDYFKEFAKTLNDFISEYIHVLSIPLSDKWSESEINKDEVRKKIKKLQDYLKSNIRGKEVGKFDSGDTAIVFSFKDNLNRYVA